MKSQEIVSVAVQEKVQLSTLENQNRPETGSVSEVQRYGAVDLDLVPLPLGLELESFYPEDGRATSGWIRTRQWLSPLCPACAVEPEVAPAGTDEPDMARGWMEPELVQGRKEPEMVQGSSESRGCPDLGCCSPWNNQQIRSTLES